MAGSNAGARTEDRRSRRNSTLLLAAALCVALAAVLVAHAGAYTRNVNTFGGSGEGAGNLRLPGAIAVSPDGSHVYVADTGNDRISEFTARGSFVRAWGWGVSDGRSQLETCTETCLAGQGGRSDGELNEPAGLAVAADGTVYALNEAQFDGRVQAFDPSGPEVTYLETLPAGYEANGPGEVTFGYPLPYSNDLAVDAQGRVYVADTTEGTSRISVFEPGTGLVETIPVTAVERITAFALTPAGNIWITDRGGDTYLQEKDGSVVFKLGFFFSISSLTVDPGTGNLIVEPTALEKGKLLLTEFDEAGTRLGTVSVEGISEEGGEPYNYGLAINEAFQFEAENENPLESEPGVTYVANRYGGGVIVLAEAKPLEPTLKSASGEERVGAREVGSTGATLAAELRARGLDTHVYFEFGPTAAYGSASPLQPGFDFGESFLTKTFSTRLAGLQPNSTYHYRVVATNSAGTVTSPDRTFTTFPVGGPFSLPDGRAYELASPEAGTNSLGGLFAAPAGDGVAFSASSALPGSSAGGVGSTYVGLRGGEGWRREAATVPLDAAASTPTLMISADMSKTVGPSPKVLTPGAPAGGEKLYLRDNASDTYELMTPIAPESFPGYSIYGASADAGHVFFRAFVPLTPDTPGGFLESLYEFSDGSLRNVGILPGATEPSGTTIEATDAPNAVSEDGSRVFFVTEPAPGEAPKVFARTDDSQTIEISASQATTPDPEAASQPARFVGATPDGSVAYFTSSARLTDDAYTGKNTATGELQDTAPNLYRYDFATGRLTDLTVATGAEDEERGASVTGSVVVAAGGTSAYFVATGDLAAGATTGKPNLYRWTAGGGIRFVVTLGESFSEPLAEPGAATANARTSTDGSILAFNSVTALDPAYPEFEGSENFEPLREIYRYSALDGSLVCVSCGRSEPVIRGARLTGPSGLSAGYGGHFLSADGSRIFFGTLAALVPQDTNGKADVYEWENGAPHLISSGAGTSGSALVDASASGDDVFFSTIDRLVPADQSDYYDVYDAKVGGGFPVPADASACEGEGCLPAAAAAPSTGAFGSRSFDGPGNKKVKHHRRKHKKKKHRRHRRHRQHKRSHGHPSTGKRG